MILRCGTSPKLEHEKKLMTSPEILDRYRDIIVNTLKARIDQDHLFVYDMLRYCMGWSDKDGIPVNGVMGKSLRPSLCLFACEAVGGNMRNALPAAASLELIHNFSLIHDEIEDFDETRHHRPTLWALWGINKALVAGNALRIVADQSMEMMRKNDDKDTERILKGVELLTEACLEMIEGQYMDISFEGRIDITLNQYMSMISRKTGALIRCALHLGAVMGTENLRTLEIFRRTGTSLGYVFQIRDDILGIWGQEESTGKPVGIDILRKKNSLPIVHAMDKADSKGRERLREIYSLQSLGEPEVLAVLDIMEQAGTRDYAQGLAHQYEEEALKSFSDAMLPDSYKFDFGVLSHFLAVREY